MTLISSDDTNFVPNEHKGSTYFKHFQKAGTPRTLGVMVSVVGRNLRLLSCDGIVISHIQNEIRQASHERGRQ